MILGAITIKSVSTNDLEALVSAGAGKADTENFHGEGRGCSNIDANASATLGNGGSGENFSDIADNEMPKLLLHFCNLLEIIISEEENFRIGFNCEQIF